jgi:hypothetical protein
MSKTANENITEVGSAPERNRIEIYDAHTLKTGKVNKHGRMFISKKQAGERVRFAVVPEGVITSLGSIEDRTLVMNDVTEVDSGKITGNGELFLGKQYAGEEVTVSISPTGDYDTVSSKAKSNIAAQKPDTQS